MDKQQSVLCLLPLVNLAAKRSPLLRAQPRWPSLLLLLDRSRMFCKGAALLFQPQLQDNI